VVDQFSSLKRWLTTRITRTTLLDEPQRQILLNGLREMPDGDRLCRGDFHPRNVLDKASQPIAIDWPNACCGDPAADVCRSYLILKLHADEVAAVPRYLLSGRPWSAPDQHLESQNSKYGNPLFDSAF
jgi:aminoglycoside phosphotransferase (APT) family kinase protein